MNKEAIQPVFARLKAILQPYAAQLMVVADKDDHFYLDTAHLQKNKKPLFFGAVTIKKSYVSFHLMPVYVFSELLDDASPELKQCMQGKSCFNFKATDETLFQELSQLTQAGFARFKAEKYV
ncbi:MAG: hypothetical protein HOP19_22210 [Acidobacteria bacterium]|nr:hypothetical protein [Acidobacteriota bacterium]